MRILLDMDGVLADCLGYWLGLLNRYHGLDLKPTDITEWDTHRFCKDVPESVVYGYLSQPGFFRHLQPVEGAIDGVNYLISEGHEVVIVTSCPREYGESDKRQWLKSHIPKLDPKNFISAHRKDLIQGDILLDDGVHNLEAWRDANIKGLAVCFDQPYNRSYIGARSYDWKDFLRMF